MAANRSNPAHRTGASDPPQASPAAAATSSPLNSAATKPGTPHGIPSELLAPDGSKLVISDAGLFARYGEDCRSQAAPAAIRRELPAAAPRSLLAFEGRFRPYTGSVDYALFCLPPQEKTTFFEIKVEARGGQDDNWSLASHRLVSAYLARPVDKTEQRRIAATIGIFKQPEQIDLRGHPMMAPVSIKPADAASVCIDWFKRVNRDGETVVLMDANGVTENPVLKIQRTAAAAGHAVGISFFENFEWSPPRKLSKALELGNFLKQHFHMARFGSEDHADRAALTESVIDAVTRQLKQSPDEALYLKSSTTSGGRMIWRIRAQSGRPVLESSSPDSFDTVKDFLEWFEESKRRLEYFEGRGGTEVLRQDARRMLEERRPTTENLLRRILGKMSNPILERAIPADPVRLVRNGVEQECLAELRVIIQSPTLRAEDLRVVADYAKTSTSDIAANVALGGWGSATREVLQALYRKHEPQLTGSALVEALDREYQELVKKCAEFGLKFRGASSLSSISRNNFAVDLRPVWNPAERKIDLWLIEVQSPFGFSGLEELSPESAAKVRENGAAVTQEVERLRRERILNEAGRNKGS